MIFEWDRFNHQVQLEGESAEQFIVELYNLAEFCNYGELTSEMIHDRLVVGIRDHHLSECLQLDSELTGKGQKSDPPTRSCSGSAEYTQRSYRTAIQ